MATRRRRCPPNCPPRALYHRCGRTSLRAIDDGREVHDHQAAWRRAGRHLFGYRYLAARFDAAQRQRARESIAGVAADPYCCFPLEQRSFQLPFAQLFGSVLRRGRGTARHDPLRKRSAHAYELFWGPGDAPTQNEAVALEASLEAFAHRDRWTDT